MEIRNLVKAGAVSFTVSLPKSWIDRNSLKKGDSVYIRENSPKELTVTAEIPQERINHKEVTIESLGKEIATLRREITSAYINNYSTITIIGEKIDQISPDVRKIVHDFIAIEIVEQDARKIVAKDYLNLKEVSIEKTIKRVDMIIRSMLSDSLLAMTDKTLVQGIVQRDIDVNRFYFLLMRLLKGCLSDQSLSSFFNLSNSKALSYILVTINLENIGDNIKDIAQQMDGLEQKADIKEFEHLYRSIQQAYLDAMKSFYLDDKSLAEKVAGGRLELLTMFDSYVENHKTPMAARLIENLKDIQTEIGNVARVVLDSL
jgi:phosphate uptake regulator